MEANESCVIVGGRKSLPQVFIATEAETGGYNLRHRYSSGSSSVGTPNCITPPISTSTPHVKVTNMPSFGTPGCYGSFKPTSYTDAYVPPLSLNNENFTGQYQHSTPGKTDQIIKIDSGYGGFSNSSSPYNLPEGFQTSCKSANPSMWDTLVASPVQNLRQKLRGRPSYLDESHSRSWKIQPQQVLACLIFLVILTSVGFAFLISYKHFITQERKEDMNGKNKSIEFGKKGKVQDTIEDLETQITEVNEDSDEQSFLLKDDVTFEEVVKRKMVLEGKVNSMIPTTGKSADIDKSVGDDAPAVVLKRLADSVEELLAGDDSLDVKENYLVDDLGLKESEIKFLINNEVNSYLLKSKIEDATETIVNSGAENNADVVRSTKKKTKNTNPLVKTVPAPKKSKFKISKQDEILNEESKQIQMSPNENLDSLDDPIFPAGQPEERIKREETEDEVIFGDKFRKYKDDDGGFRKQEEAVAATDRDD